MGDKELDPSQHPKEGTHCNENGSVLKTHREIDVIVTRLIPLQLPRGAGVIDTVTSLSLQHERVRIHTPLSSCLQELSVFN